MNFTQRILALVAVLFGVVTIVAGTRVLLGFDPGYLVYRPLLTYNTVMGFAYLGAGVLAWVNLRRGQHAAAAIFVLNALMFAFVGYLYANGGGVAVESIRAMTLRTGVWLLLFVGLVWLGRRNRRNDLGDA